MSSSTFFSRCSGPTSCSSFSRHTSVFGHGRPRAVLTCSAVRLAYRQQLRQSVPGLCFVYLELSRETAGQRVASRPDHFMPASLIDSQFAALEPPHVEPLTLALDATLPVDLLSLAAETWWKSADVIARPA